ncbi:response regulator receiver domain-containing protein [Apiospora arundinis]
MHTASPISTATTNGHVQHTSAPGTANVEQSTNHHPHPHQAPTAPPMPTPPIAERVETPPPRIASPRPSARAKKNKKNVDHPSLPPGMLNGGVPPINVLIVEDNIINLKLLEAFVKRLKVRWQTAMNGRDAVTKWRDGGFHLVLMDIQLPVMNGLEATREIRRLEKVNSIGVFSSSASSAPEEVKGDPAEEDKLSNTEMFKSPVIIVALTASSLQSDRHEALAAGCNDFLTKPVNFVWLERKVMEWGCMQALIDFDGWRKWKDFSQKTEESDAAKKAAAAKAKAAKKNRLSMTTVAAA